MKSKTLEMEGVSTLEKVKDFLGMLSKSLDECEFDSITGKMSLRDAKSKVVFWLDDVELSITIKALQQ